MSKRGPDMSKRGPDMSKRGPDMSKRGPDMSKRGPDMSKRGPDYLVVAAIDFGTTYSGYAYSFRSDFESDPLRIYANSLWKNEGDGTYKTPTSILYDEHRDFHSFGYAAEKKYNSLACDKEEDDEEDDDEDEDTKSEDDEYKKWYYFRRFKMELYRQYNTMGSTQDRRTRNRRISEDMKLKDDTGKTMKAIDVFAGAIKYLKEHFLGVLGERLTTLEERPTTLEERLTTLQIAPERKDKRKEIINPEEIRWVLTVPAIWSAQAKQFMRRAANQAGIQDHQLFLALEPEAASIYCKHITLQEHSEFKGKVSTFSPAHRFLVVDCGGGTVDIIAHEVCGDGSLKELHHATGNAAGGINVDKNFFNYLKFVFTEEVYRSFSEKNPQARLDLEKAFEAKKRAIGNEETEEITFSDLGTLMATYQKMFPDNKISKRLADIGHKDMVRTFKTKMRFKPAFLKEKAFSEPVESIVSSLRNLFGTREISDIRTVLLVGGFSDSHVVRDELKISFPEKTFLHPPEASLAVVKGAVLFGHSTKDKPQISSRRSDMTYGVCTNEPFNEKIHKQAHKCMIDGVYKCTDIFKVMVKKNDVIVPGKTSFEEEFNPSSSATVMGNVEIYQSSSDCPMYVNDEGCSLVGKLEISLPPASTVGSARTIKVTMHFGDTELYVTAVDTVGGRRCEAKLDLLSRR